MKTFVIRDYGFSNEIAKLYSKGWQNQRNAARNNDNGGW